MVTTKSINLDVRLCQALKTELILGISPLVDLRLQQQKKSIRKRMAVRIALHRVTQVRYMSLIKDFNDLHIGTKGTILNILSAVPFFFIGTYLFNPDLVQKVQGNTLTDIDFYFLLSICLALSTLWFFMNFIISIKVLDVVNWIERLRQEDKQQDENNNPPNIPEKEAKDTKTEDDEELAEIFVVSYIYSIGYLALAIFINIWIGFSFKWFVVSCFGFIVFRLAWVVLWHGIFKKIELKYNGKVDR